MEQLTANIFIETGLKGANHGVVTTSDGLVLIDTPHKPSDAVRLKAFGRWPSVICACGAESCRPRPG